MIRLAKKLVVFIIVCAIVGVLGLLIGLGSWAYQISRHVPDISKIKSYRPDLSAEILDTHGRVMAYLFDREHRLWVSLSEIAKSLQMAVIVAEDDTFFQHRGINYQETWNAFKQDLEKGRYARGGSTITQQLAKNLFLSKEKTLERKVKEFFLTREIERTLSKKRILELYLNEVEWGDSIYGAGASARYYFGKPASHLELHESALLAAMLPNPKYFNPYIRPERVKKRQQRILRLMYSSKLLTREELLAAQAAPLALHEGPENPLWRTPKIKAKTRSNESCPMQYLEEYLLRRYGGQQLYRGGMKVRTTLDSDLQSTLEIGIKESLPFLEDDLRALAQPVSASDQWILVMRLENIPRALVCIERERTGRLLLNRLESSRPPDALFDYTLERAKAIRWTDIVLDH